MFAFLVICLPCYVFGLIFVFVIFLVYDNLNKFPSNLCLFLIFFCLFFVVESNVDYPFTSNVFFSKGYGLRTF